MHLVGPWAALVGLACTVTPDGPAELPETPATSGSTSVAPPIPGGSSFGESSGSTAAVDDEDDGDPLLLDVASPDSADPDAQVGCNKADILFVIDQSGSMQEEQAGLVASVPGFIDTMLTQVENIQSLHIGVVSTGEFGFNSANGNDSGVCELGGALVTQTYGPDSSNAICGPYGNGKAFMTDQDDLDTALPCAIQLGTGGSIRENHLDWTRAALSEELNAPGACNDGFLRDDALLILVIISDEDDINLSGGTIPSGSAGGPFEWFQDLQAIKGLETNVAVLSIVPLPAPSACDALLDPKDSGFYFVADRLIAFTEQFTYGDVGDICAPEFSTFFADSVATIDAACEDFVPEG